MSSQPWKVHGALLSVALIYGASYSIAKLIMPEFIGPFGFILIRATAATLIFLLIYHAGTGEKIQHKRDILRLFVCGLFGITCNQLLFFNGLSMTSTVSASVLMTTNPIIVLVLTFFTGTEKITRTKVLGVMVGSIGAVMLILRGEVSWEQGAFLGDFLILMNATSYAVYLILVKPLMARYQSITVMRWVFLFGTMMIIPFGWEETLEVDWVNFPTVGWFSLAFVIIFTSVLAYLLNVWALKFVHPSIVSYYIYLQPFFATLISLIFLDEPFGILMIVYSLLIFTGVFLVSKRTR